jgi:hypothetical protein
MDRREFARSTGPAIDVDDAVVFIDEVVFCSEDEDFRYCSGRFSASLTSKPSAEPDELGPQGVDVEEAIAWGRERASVVIVFAGHDRKAYSAGSRQLRGERLPPWSPGGRFPRVRKLDHAMPANGTRF